MDKVETRLFVFLIAVWPFVRKRSHIRGAVLCLACFSRPPTPVFLFLDDLKKGRSGGGVSVSGGGPTRWIWASSCDVYATSVHSSVAVLSAPKLRCRCCIACKMGSVGLDTLRRDV